MKHQTPSLDRQTRTLSRTMAAIHHYRTQDRRTYARVLKVGA